MTVVEKIGFYLALVAIAMISFWIFFSQNGWMDYRRLQEREVMLQERIQVAREKNKKLEQQILLLKQDRAYLKHLAKQEHEMVEEDELIFKLKP